MTQNLYIKNIDGVAIIKDASSITVKKGDSVIYNPSEETLLSDGWMIYTPVENPVEDIETPSISEIIKTDEKDKIEDEIVEDLPTKKQKLIEEILKYDSSDNVNIFILNGEKMWLDKMTRVGLKLRFESELENCIDDTILWYNNKSYPIKIEVATKMLSKLEVYASHCYDNTQRHIANVENLNTYFEVETYDYKSGYPEILSF